MKLLAVLVITLSPLVMADSAIAYEWKDADVEAMAARAEATVQKAFNIIWAVREQLQMADTTHDPNHTGVIGVEYTPLTTTTGYEDAKELATHAGWAAWIVRDLCKRGFAPGANVALSMSGSFPGLNIAVYAALQELDADVKGVSSIGASSWGANQIGFSWPEIEQLLHERGVLTIGSGAVSLGGTGDRGAEWGDYSMQLAMAAVKNSRLPLIKPTHLEDAVRKRMRFYGDARDYVCYINVGGNHASLGGGAQMRFTTGGWYYDPVKLRGDPNGVMDYFLDAGVPCLNLLFLRELNYRYDIVSPNSK